MTNLNDEYKKLRGYLNPSIRGAKTDAVLESLATASFHLVNNVVAMNDSLYITSASETYLDDRLAEFGVIRPETIGLSDDIFKQLGIEVVNRKQVRDLIMKILEIIYGEEYARATSKSNFVEPYSLEDGDSLIISYDDQAPITVVFSSSQFTNINSATAQEVSDAITRATRNQGRTGSAYAKDDGEGSYVTLIPDTSGPASSVRVLGGKAQNKLSFNQSRPTSAGATTQWTIENFSGTSRMTWSGGANPTLGKARKGDYINVYGTGFNPLNKGTFTITKVNSGTIDNAYVEFANPVVSSEIAVQGTDDGVLFFYPERITPTSKPNYALAFQTSSKLLEVFMPAIPRVVRRGRIGSAHIQDGGASVGTDYGPYVFDTSAPYSIRGEECSTAQIVDSNSTMIINVDDSSSVSDSAGYLVFDFGGPLEEGPVPYLGRPSSNSLMINPTYRFKNIHNTGTNISLIGQNYSPVPDETGIDYSFYVTGTADGRIYAQDLINSIAATGIIINIVVLYPNPIGLGKKEEPIIWGI